jgi:hypothetical protein
MKKALKDTIMVYDTNVVYGGLTFSSVQVQTAI